METEPKNYEIAYLITPEVGEDGVFGVAGKVTSLIQDANGAVSKIEEPKKRRLAYHLGKHRFAYFGWTTFSMYPEQVEVLKKKLNFEEKSLLRFLVVFVPKRVHEYVRRTPFQKRPDKPQGTTPAIPRETEEKERMNIAELDKKLEEILGKE
ncbi:MAG: hypothetical protein A3A28_01200 [Candidatus Sungbacteria bacterium RIFCSPLOWO2_01_FULL_47_32]|uniref:Small ribosomal subunit protein bS6 n=1 Tax=Candidatus Sungbacteria bacterium RIFCSPHIGHO2_01_FULL_47_32 TaxID=1802264 RepID=A0A1G2K951_9BACT|nr:MAG: 30S ribosomal protein S6 [Parcubacteria group bacterium GW2011_GWA2_47_10]OGZ95753.1 MAG: hypothetical protein A2633_00455 [Candidatus Sungbacteria bacterium RIFCSPHIGHO2_01_FULL_47_32]OGZ99069.1 MAG: hypothetical protein A3D57_03380 [Candidatus Sungbacteria bacterium RIFCSPHIGHO2_02_FULL_46_12]OHA04560.1 MAG: hypothetical protein A3A28_01200 [Candidatus Sungbacteria bacterium RIFCSPLOWO2_01_FULL_47_32]